MKYLPHIALMLITVASIAFGYFTKPVVQMTSQRPPKDVASAAPQPPERSTAERLADVLGQPVGTISDDELASLSEELASTDLESAVRVLMLCQKRPQLWIEKLERLSQENPPALARLLGEAKEARFRNDLEAYLLKVQFSSDPEGLFNKALTVQNRTKTGLLLLALDAVSTKDPSREIALAQSLAPGVAKMAILNRALGPAMEEDPQGTLRWIAQNGGELAPHQLQNAMLDYQKKNPDRTKEIVINAPLEIQRDLMEAVMVGMKGTSEAKLEFLRSLPSNLRDAGLRAIRGDSLRNEILPKLTPEERPAAVEMTTWWASEKEQSAWLDTLQTPEDKAAAARVIPHLPFVTEKRKAELLQRLNR